MALLWHAPPGMAVDEHSAFCPPGSPHDVSAVVGADEDMRCAYSSKKCTNPRTTKKGGGLHRFCEFHRRRANKNQWRVDDKRRGLRAARRQMLKRARALTLPDPVGLLDTCAMLTSEDIQLLQALLLEERASRSHRKLVSATRTAAQQPGALQPHDPSGNPWTMPSRTMESTGYYGDACFV